MKTHTHILVSVYEVIHRHIKSIMQINIKIWYNWLNLVSSFFCHVRTVETCSGYYSEPKKPGKSSEALLVASWAVLALGWGDSGGAVER